VGVCSKCGTEAEADARFCPSCAEALRECPACGFTNRLSSQACTECGRHFDATEEEADAPSPALAAPAPAPGPPIRKHSPLAAVWAPLAVGLAIATVVIAAFGLGGPPRSGDIPAGYITIAGSDPATARVVRLDMSKPIPIAGRLPPAAAHADSVKLTFKAADVELGSAADAIIPAQDGSFTATFKTSGGRYLLAGKAAAQLEFLQGDATRAQQNFVVRSTQWALATIPAIVSLVGMWALLNRIGWIWRSMYKGRRRRFGAIRLAGLGALAGGVLVGLAWLVLARAPMLSTVWVCAALGAGAGFCGGMAALCIGDRRRSRRPSQSSQIPTKPALQDAPAG